MKPVLLLSPSLGTTASLFWESQLPAFGDHFDVLRHDHPGHGEAPVPDGPVRVADIARGVLALLDEAGAERASFCGVSLGGMVGMWLAANTPERVNRLVLACTGASLGTKALYDERAALVRAEGTAVVLDGTRERWFTPSFRDSSRAGAILDELRRVAPEGYAACCEAVGDFDFHGDLDRIAAPTLVVHGEDDPVTPPGVIDELVTGIPGARRAGIPHAAHLANVEQPDAFNAAVLAHLTERTAA
jgi:3-oxoadipate enol-lactonase